MDAQRDRQKTFRQTDRWADGQTEGWRDRETDRHKERKTDRQTDEWTDRLIMSHIMPQVLHLKNYLPISISFQ